ncbi:ABC transporter permease, partial [Cellulomonas bogoriensis 69B4 = DSM 16987]
MTRSTTARSALLLGAVVLLVAAVALSLTVGSRDIAPTDVWRLLRAPDGTGEAAVIHEIRLPRTLLGIAAGAALGLAGALMQSLTRNPLAEPGLLGVNAGAAVAVVGGVTLLGLTEARQYVWLAFGGAGAAAVVVYLVGGTTRGRAGTSPVRLALAGAAVTAALMALVSGLIYTDAQALDRYRFWAVGSLSGRDLTVLWQVAPFLVAGLLLGLVLAPALNAMALGDDTGRALGARPGLV